MSPNTPSRHIRPSRNTCRSSTSGEHSDPSGKTARALGFAPDARMRSNTSTDSSTFLRMANAAANSGGHTRGYGPIPATFTSAPASRSCHTTLCASGLTPSAKRPTARVNGYARSVTRSSTRGRAKRAGAFTSAPARTSSDMMVATSPRARTSRSGSSPPEMPSASTADATITDAATRVSRCVAAMTFAASTAASIAPSIQPEADEENPDVVVTSAGAGPPSPPAPKAPRLVPSPKAPTPVAAFVVFASPGADNTDGTRDPATEDPRGHQLASRARADRPSSALTHIANNGVPGPQCPGRDPMHDASPPARRIARKMATAGAPAPSAAAHAACHSGGPDAVNGARDAFAPHSPGATRRDLYSSAVGACVNSEASDASTPSAASIVAASRTSGTGRPPRSSSAAVSSIAASASASGVSWRPHRRPRPGVSPRAFGSAPATRSRAARSRHSSEISGVVALVAATTARNRGAPRVRVAPR